MNPVIEGSTPILSNERTHFDTCALPPKARDPAIAQIRLVGLDTTLPLHSRVWETFIAENRAPLQFQIRPIEHNFPTAKPKRTNFEWYLVRGILKRQWMAKHLEIIPAVAAVCFDLDWSDLKWAERMATCATHVHRIRASLQERHTRLAVILIQQTPPLPPNEDMLGTERAQAFCTACDLSPKSLFVLPVSDHLHGYVMRIQSALLELAQTAYQSAIRRVKAHRDLLNRTTHGALLVRHQFKLGFFAELKGDLPLAQKHYTQSYTQLVEIRVSDGNSVEVKSVASVITLRLCRLAFARSLPRDALAHFQHHIEVFRCRTGSASVTFEHQAWMSMQCQMFAEIFDAAVRHGLAPAQTQHPGFYYQQAAQHATLRRQLAEELLSANPSFSPGLADIPNTWTLPEFVGQRPWRAGRYSLEVGDLSRERQSQSALLLLEKQFNHGAIVAELLAAAAQQFQRFRCPRMRVRLQVALAEETARCGDGVRALSLLSQPLHHYRVEKWGPLLLHALILGQKAAILAEDVTAWIQMILQLLSPTLPAVKEHRTIWWSNLNDILEDKLPQNIIPSDNNTLRTAILNAPKYIQLDLAIFPSFLCASARFVNKCVDIPESVDVLVDLKNSSTEPVTFSSVGLSVSENSAVPTVLSRVVDKEKGIDLFLNAGQTIPIMMTFNATPNQTGYTLQIPNVQVTLGNPLHRQLILIVPNDANNSDEKLNVKPRKGLLVTEFTHNAPALIDEVYPIVVKLRNEENTSISDIRVTCTIILGEIPVGATLKIPDSETNETEVCIVMDTIPQGGSTEQVVLVLPKDELCLDINMKVNYLVELPEGQCTCQQETTLQLDCVPPFTMSSEVLSCTMEPLPRISPGEPFLVVVTMNSTSPWPITTTKTELIPPNNRSTLESKLLSTLDQIDNVVLNRCEASSICMYMEVPFVEDYSLEDLGSMPLGSLKITWHRVGSNGTKEVSETIYMLPHLSLALAPVLAEASIPSQGQVRTPLALTISIKNTSPNTIFLAAIMEASDAFMFAGGKSIRLFLPPYGDTKVSLNLYPLLAGFVALPQLRLAPITNDEDATVQQNWEVVLERMLPSHVYIAPQAKGLSNAEHEVAVV